MEVGNFTRVEKVFGSPDLSPFISGDLTDPYRTIDLHGLKNVTRGSGSYIWSSRCCKSKSI